MRPGLQKLDGDQGAGKPVRSQMGEAIDHIAPEAHARHRRGVRADPTTADLVYVAGYEYTMARVDATQAAGQQVTYLSYTPNDRDDRVDPDVPENYGQLHVDFEAITFGAENRLLVGSHGGLYRLPNPRGPASQTPPLNYWVPIMGNIRAVQFDSIAYDSLSKVILGGAG